MHFLSSYATATATGASWPRLSGLSLTRDDPTDSPFLPAEATTRRVASEGSTPVRPRMTFFLGRMRDSMGTTMAFPMHHTHTCANRWPGPSRPSTGPGGWRRFAVGAQVSLTTSACLPVCLSLSVLVAFATPVQPSTSPSKEGEASVGGERERARPPTSE